MFHPMVDYHAIISASFLAKIRKQNLKETDDMLLVTEKYTVRKEWSDWSIWSTKRCLFGQAEAWDPQ